MCDGMKILKELYHKQEPLQCLAHNITKCWCNKIERKFTHSDDFCLSPKELLDAHSALLGECDLKYLKELAGREFILV